MSAPPYVAIGLETFVPQQTQRAVVGRPFTAQFTFGADGDALPDAVDSVPDAVNVTVANAEGYTVASGTADVGDVQTNGTQVAAFALTPAELPQRDVLTVTWQTTIGGDSVSSITTIDVCDARLFPLSEYLEYADIVKKNPSAAVQERERTRAEDYLERECGRAFTGRFGIEVHRLAGVHRRHLAGSIGFGPGLALHPSGVGKVVLRQPYVQAIRSLSRVWWDETDTMQAVVLDVSRARLDPSENTLEYHDTNGEGLWGTVIIGFEHGRYLPDVHRVCAILARHRILKGPLDDRATQLSTEVGVVNLLTPGVQGSRSGIPEVDQFIAEYNAHALGFISS